MNIENSIRKTSLIFHHGIGGLWTNNSDETFIIKTVKFWHWESDKGEAGVINEEHLRDFLGVEKILFPPGGKDKHIPFIGGNIGIGRFPGWHRCKGWRKFDDGRVERCGAMYQLSQTDSISLCTHPSCSANSKRALAPVRFMKICSNGHLDDFPFHQWVHRGVGFEEHKLRYINKSGSGLSGIYIQCETCSSVSSKKERSMQGALTPDSFKDYICSGRIPWQNNQTEKCISVFSDGRNKSSIVQVGVQKSSSNLLFPIIRNAIFCPGYDSLPAWIKNLLEHNNHKSLIKKIDAETVMDLEAVVNLTFNYLPNDKKEQLRIHIQGIRDYLYPAPTDDPFKDNGYLGIMQREYDRFLNFPVDQKLDDFTIERPPMSIYPEVITGMVERVVLIDKLRDTRVYIGFTRVEPHDTDAQGLRLSELINKCYGSNEVVGDIVRGEGIFLKFNEARLLEWTANDEVLDRLKLLSKERLEQLISRQYIGSEKQAAIYLFIHSLSHALMCSLAGIAGYNIASIRERVYVGKDGRGGHMYGLLIYTSDGDSEGSLGGLVRVGRPEPLGRIFNHAIKYSQWCTSDPLCSS